ncbi:lasso peptide biosynthesis B2 protein [Streptomyces xinghaiensis]|uniref:lasso peptide biosynthesis B2 protein n=1 Tax=Streptomyces xinghaiensis TaxID=1038928 RepID=UPI000BAF5513|nr:lasso peptide biosynthesis B2 protein [Streptomyces xinghaiensis]
MSTPAALDRPSGVPLIHRLAARAVLPPAYLLARLRPRRIRRLLEAVRRGARPASPERTLAARNAVCSVSLFCAGPQGCLPRSLAAALLCRIRGEWPTWCTGVRVVPPFTAHAWLEADGRPVDEGVPDGYFTRLLSVPPRRRAAG